MLIFAVDIEASGQHPKNNFATQVGMACIDVSKYDPLNVKECIVSTFSTYLRQPEGTEWEARCVSEFWKKNPIIYEETTQGIVDAPENGIEQLLNWINEHKDANPENNVLITDNSAFDFVFLSKILENHCQRSLLYLFGAYENTPIDVSSFYLGLSKRNIHKNGTWSSLKSACASLNTTLPSFKEMLELTPHDAGSDALIIALNYTHILSCLE